eukprot:TRINITY_DN3835_c0_g1_i1.p2 TRINITY_DN3835_c0_g1~~TRINITY_DN3835_c0_g1_i1.p2  ORF type:complete len:217 (+),score=44.06 TRINITY_DN3835_c0_g1_i1:281-931(+)
MYLCRGVAFIVTAEATPEFWTALPPGCVHYVPVPSDAPFLHHIIFRGWYVGLPEAAYGSLFTKCVPGMGWFWTLQVGLLTFNAAVPALRVGCLPSLWLMAADQIVLVLALIVLRPYSSYPILLLTTATTAMQVGLLISKICQAPLDHVFLTGTLVLVLLAGGRRQFDFRYPPPYVASNSRLSNPKTPPAVAGHRIDGATCRYNCVAHGWISNCTAT